MIREAQAIADFFRDLDADIDMTVEPDSVRGHSECCRLSDIVQQGAPGQRRRTRMREMLEQQESMDKHIPFRMKLQRLFDTFHHRDFGKHFLEQAALIQQVKCALSVALDEHFRKFVTNPFAGDYLNLASLIPNGGECLRVDFIFKARREAYCAQHAQFVFRKTQFWIADGADDAGFEIVASARKIEYFSAYGIEHHAVNREVSAGNIFTRITAEAHFVRMTSVGVTEIAAERRYLDRI